MTGHTTAPQEPAIRWKKGFDRALWVRLLRQMAQGWPETLQIEVAYPIVQPRVGPFHCLLLPPMLDRPGNQRSAPPVAGTGALEAGKLGLQIFDSPHLSLANRGLRSRRLQALEKEQLPPDRSRRRRPIGCLTTCDNRHRR